MNQLQSNLEKLPDWCYGILHRGNQSQVIKIKKGEQGYYKVPEQPIWKTHDELDAYIDQKNMDELGVSLAQREAMEIGSLCGFDVPGADPDNCLI